MKLTKTASGKYKMSKKDWENIGKQTGWITSQLFSRTDYVTVGPTPSGENCVQVGEEDYEQRSRVETRAYINQLRRQFPNVPEGAKFAIKSFPHDFGTYSEVVVKYLEDNEEAVNFAFEVENNTPNIGTNKQK